MRYQHNKNVAFGGDINDAQLTRLGRTENPWNKYTNAWCQGHMSIVRDAADIGGTANETDEGCCLNGKTLEKYGK